MLKGTKQKPLPGYLRSYAFNSKQEKKSKKDEVANVFFLSGCHILTKTQGILLITKLAVTKILTK